MNLRYKNHRAGERGMAVLVVIAVLSILLVFVAGNLRALHLLRNDLRSVESQQTNRLAHVEVTSNEPPSTATRTDQ